MYSGLAKPPGSHGAIIGPDIPTQLSIMLWVNDCQASEINQCLVRIIARKQRRLVNPWLW
ncbi:hypothetical protein AOX56_16115 [Aeromonas sobria]|uniref:Uncharacterized protein n=1 Tax=Aeromonas sobria TaxID=646 RepID=A0A2N3IYJ7_AERSO|nr:hypothetical protein AOX56_16115 [Aeromonas sobria]